jgi:hypothetical protein
MFDIAVQLQLMSVKADTCANKSGKEHTNSIRRLPGFSRLVDTLEVPCMSRDVARAQTRGHGSKIDQYSLIYAKSSCLRVL